MDWQVEAIYPIKGDETPNAGEICWQNSRSIVLVD